MGKILESYPIQLPSYCLSYLFNSDPSGLEDNDIRDTDEGMNFYYDRAKELGGTITINIPENMESYFSPNPEFGLPCDVIDTTIHIFEGA